MLGSAPRVVASPVVDGSTAAVVESSTAAAFFWCWFFEGAMLSIMVLGDGARLRFVAVFRSVGDCLKHKNILAKNRARQPLSAACQRVKQKQAMPRAAETPSGSETMQPSPRMRRKCAGFEQALAPILRHAVQAACVSASAGRENESPLLNMCAQSLHMPMPISLTRQLLTSMSARDYVCAPKLDGVRALIVHAVIQGVSIVARIDRCADVHVVCSRWAESGGGAMLTRSNSALKLECLVDAEFMRSDQAEEVGDGPEASGTFHVHDVFVYDACSVARSPHSVRMAIVACAVSDLQAELVAAGASPGLRVERKIFRPLSAVASLRDVPRSDGLILMESRSPLLGGGARAMLKWKPPRLNTIDLRVNVDTRRVGAKIVRAGGVDCTAGMGPSVAALVATMHNGKKPPMITNLQKVADALPSIHLPMIWEFEQDVSSGVWHAIKPRPDKATANAERTVKATLQNVIESIAFDELVTIGL